MTLFDSVPEPAQGQMEGLTFSYTRDGRGFSLSIRSLVLSPHRVHVIYGTNGSGKTSLLRGLAGTLAPQEGRILWNGLETSLLPGKELAFVTQAEPWPHWTVERNIIEPLIQIGQTRRAAASRAADVIFQLGLRGFERRYPHQLSAGQKQRTALARALALQPKVLLLDEILSAQSERWAATSGNLLRQLALLGRVVVVISHDPEWVLAYADRVTNLATTDLEDSSTSAYHCAFDGSPKEWEMYRRAQLKPESRAFQ